MAEFFFFSVVGWPSYVSGFVPAPLLTFACRSSDGGRNSTVAGKVSGKLKK